MIKKLVTIIKGIVKVARMVSSDDSGDFQQGRFFYMGREVTGNVLKQYGLLSKAPDNSFAVLFSQNGQGSNVLAMVDDPKRRPFRNLAEGEVVLSNYLAEQYLHLKENGDAELSATRVIILVGGTTVTIEDGTMTIDSVDTTLTGNLQVDGDITTNGGVTADAAGAGVTLTGHQHPTAATGPPSSPTPGT